MAENRGVKRPRHSSSETRECAKLAPRSHVIAVSTNCECSSGECSLGECSPSECSPSECSPSECSPSECSPSECSPSECSPSECSPSELERSAHEDQGEHEMEFCAGDESELLTKKTICDKDSTHQGFKPMGDFSHFDLPEIYHQHHLITDFIKAVAGVTVRLVVLSTSMDRPPGYTCQKMAGKTGLNRFGSGWVWSVFRSFSMQDDEVCPCKDCGKNPETAKKQWGQFIVRTANHVVFDDSEARDTVCDIGYDSEDLRDNGQKLFGVEIWMSDIIGDFSEMTCITHDQNVSRMVEENVKLYRSFFKKLESEQVANVSPRSVVVISHPHGCSKQISVGEMIEERQEYPRNWTYSTKTCPGSSGGPVLKLGDWSTLSLLPPHSGTKELNVNFSCEPWLF